MEVSRTFVLLILVSLEVGGPLAAMEAGGGFLQVNKMSSTIKPCYPSALLPLLLPGPWCGKAPSPIRSSRERGAGSTPRCSARPAAHRLRRRRGQRGRALPRGVGARPVPGDPVHLGVPLGPPRDAGVHGDDVQQGKAGRRRLLQGAIDVRRRPRLSSDNGSLWASNIPRGRPKAGKATRGADGAFATPKPILPDIEATSINELPRAHDDTKRRRRQNKSGSLCCACRAPANRRLIWRRQALLPTPPTTTTPAMRPANPSDSMRASLAVFLGDFLGGGCLVPCCGAHLQRSHVRRRCCCSLLSKDEKGLVASPATSPSPLWWGQSTMHWGLPTLRWALGLQCVLLHADGCVVSRARCAGSTFAPWPPLEPPVAVSYACACVTVFFFFVLISCSFRSCRTSLQLDNYFYGVVLMNLSSPELSVRASSTSGDESNKNDYNKILWLSECFSFNGSTDPLFTVASRGQSIWVHASLTPLRILLAGRNVFYSLVDAVIFFYGHRTLM